MLYSIYIGEVDVSDYVVKIGSVPVYSRNEDYSLVAEGYDFQISNQYSGTIAKDDPVYFYRDDELLHNGYISKISFDEKTLLNKVEVSHRLQELKDYQTDDDFGLIMDSFKVTRSVNEFDHETIRHTSLVEAIFDSIGLTIDWTRFVEKTDWTATALTGTGVSNLGVVTTPEFGDNDIYYLPHQILCINQMKVWTPYYLNTDEGTLNRIDLFELLSILASLTGYVFAPKSETEYYCLNDKTELSFEDDELVDYEEEEIENRTSSLSVRYTTLKLTAGFYNSFWFPTASGQAYYYDDTAAYNGDPNDCEEYINNLNTNIGDESQIKWFNNFNPFVLIYDSDRATHQPYVVEPKFSESFPLYYQKFWKTNDFWKVNLKTFGPILLPDLNANFISVKITDINNDLVEVEYLDLLIG